MCHVSLGGSMERHHESFAGQSLISLHVTAANITCCTFKWKETRTCTTDSCCQWNSDCCWVWRTLPCLPDCRHVEAIRYPFVQSRCQSEFAWLLPESHLSCPRWELLTIPSTTTAGRFAFGLKSLPILLPPQPTDGLREADKKGNRLRSKEKKNWKSIQQQLGETGREPASISGLLCADTSLPGPWPLLFRPPSQLLVTFPEQL